MCKNSKSFVFLKRMKTYDYKCIFIASTYTFFKAWTISVNDLNFYDYYWKLNVSFEPNFGQFFIRVWQTLLARLVSMDTSYREQDCWESTNSWKQNEEKQCCRRRSRSQRATWSIIIIIRSLYIIQLWKKIEAKTRWI